MKSVDFLGWVLVLLTVLNFFYMIFSGTWVHVFWLCNHIPLILGVCILTRKKGLLILEYSFLGVGLFGWVVDYFWKGFFGVYLFHSTEYLASLDPVTVWSSVLLHVSTLSLGLVAIFMMRDRVRLDWAGWVFLGVHAFVLGLVAVWFGEYYNLNCFIVPCLPIFSERFYPLSVVLVYFGFCVFPLAKILERVANRIV